MELQIIKTLRKLPGLLIPFSFFIFLMNACYYDNEEELYPVLCDTTNVTYANVIVPIIEINCNVCHSQILQSGGIVTEDYNSLVSLVDNGRLLGAINHDPGYSPMPKDGNKLSDCMIRQIKTWIAEGAPNN